MKKEEILHILKDQEALLSGHFKLSSGLHSGQYLQCALVLQNPKYAERLCNTLASKFKDDNVSVVVGPALGGIVVSHETARSLGVRSIFTERRDKEMVLRRGFSLNKDDNVLVVEDVITTGLSVKEVIAVVKASGAKLIGIGAIVDRSDSKIDFGARLESLIKIDIPVFNQKDCTLCKEGVPITKPGSRT